MDSSTAHVFHVLRKLFPGNEQRYVEFLMAQMDNEITVLGMLAGGQEYPDFLKERKPPFGLSKFVLEAQTS